MNLVFGADGLTVGEGAFLMACCNHTDARGYVIASMQQLADEAHMTDRSARNNKQRLIKRGLLAAAERYHPKNGARIADLYRVNLGLLKQMQRMRTDYGPTVIEELTFAASKENRRSSPPADSSGGGEESAGGAEESAPTPPEKSASLIPPSPTPSSLSGDPSAAPEAAGAAKAVTEEREAATPNEDQTAPSPKSISDADKVVDAYMAAHMAATGMPPKPAHIRDVRAAATALLSVGRSVGNLCTLAADLASKGWTDLVRHAQMNPEAAIQAAAVRKPWCGECNDGREPMSAAQRMRTNAADRLEKCVCHPGYVPSPSSPPSVIPSKSGGTSVPDRIADLPMVGSGARPNDGYRAARALAGRRQA